MKGRKTGGRNFEPGHSGNPGGRPKLPDDVKAAAKLNKASVELALNRFLSLDRSGIRKALSEPTTPAVDLLIGSVLERAISEGDYRTLEFFLQRLVGKVHDKVEIEYPEPVVIKRRSGERVILGTRAHEKDSSNGE